MNELQFTRHGGTETTEGFIPHLKLNGIEMPVVLDVDVSSVKAAKSPQPPRRERGALVYALPGGTTFAP